MVTGGGSLSLAQLALPITLLWSALASIHGAGSRLAFDGVITTGFGYIGCFQDCDSGRCIGNRDLGGPKLELTTIGQGLRTLAQCAAFCGDYSYMGLQFTDNCFCSNTYGSQGAAPATDCDADGRVPTGGSADLCGQGDEVCGHRNAVYAVDASASMQIGSTRLVGSLTAGAAGEPWEINPPTLLADAMGALRPSFVVRSGPCTVAVVDGHSCVGRWPGGYGPNEDCEITVSVAGPGGSLGPCPVFDTKATGADYLALPDGARHGGTDGCPAGAVLGPGQTLTWHSNNYGPPAGGGGWQVCFAQ